MPCKRSDDFEMFLQENPPVDVEDIHQVIENKTDDMIIQIKDQVKEVEE